MSKLNSFQSPKDHSIYGCQSEQYTTITKDENNIIILTVTQKRAFDKIQHLFMIKNSHQSRYRGNISQHNKSHLQQTYSQPSTQWQKAEAFLLNSVTNQGHPLLPLTIWKSQPDQQRRQWHPTPVLLPGKFHGWRRLQSTGSLRVGHD